MFATDFPAFHSKGINSPDVKAVRVLIVDDHAAVHSGISSQADIETVCEAVDGNDAIRRAREHRPDVVLLDISMLRMHGFEVHKQRLAWSARRPASD